jgi:hypothetical protein
MRAACKRKTFQLVIVCHSLKKDAKQFIAANANLLCPRTPILELCRVAPEMATGHFLIYPEPESLLQCVESLIRPPTGQEHEE